MNLKKSIKSAKQQIFTILAGKRKEKFESNLEAATHIAARSQATSKAAKGNEPLNRKERTWFNQQVKHISFSI